MTSVSAFERQLDQNATDPAGVSPEVAYRQLATAAALRERLDRFGGAMLGDEVGAGKTFTTFAVLGETLIRQPQRGAVIFAPSELLKRKWERQLKDYLQSAVRDPNARRRLHRRVTTIDRTLRDAAGEWPSRNAIVVTTHNLFSYRTSAYDQGVCLGEWLERRCPARRRPWSRLFRACGLELHHNSEEGGSWARRESLSSRALEPIDAVWARWEAGDRDLGGALRDSVQEVRRELGRRLLPNAALVVIDEAHNLRSTSSRVYQSLMAVVRRRFDALLFLTATPFQLGREELRNIVEFFRYARGCEDREEDFDRRVLAMEAGMDAYMRALDEFGAAWSVLESAEVGTARDLATDRRAVAGRATRVEQAVERFHRCLKAREELERGLGPFLVRSVRERHHTEHCGLGDEIAASTPTSRIPIALVDRMIAELLASSKRSFIASALTSACSSWPALFSAAIAGEGADAASETRDLLRSMQRADALGRHPKVEQTVRVCVDGVRRGEKTLVFVERGETGKEIRDLVDERLGEQRDRNARDRLQDPARFGWPSLRENYLHTLYPVAFGPLPTPAACRSLLEEPYARKLWQRVDVEGSARDYKVEKRFLEHVIFRAGRQGTKGPSAAAEHVGRIVDPLYITNGLDLKSGESGEAAPIPSAPRRARSREPNWAFVEAYLAYPSPWVSSTEALCELDADDRAEIVDAAASAIAGSHLQREIAGIEAVGDPAAHFRAVERILCAHGGEWQDRFEAIADQAGEAAVAGTDEGTHDRVRRLAQALRSNERVQFVHGETKQGTRQNAVDGFNTPLYPEVVVATPILAEGLDLHRQCRRVVHHDLPWNPAKLEQRTGRVDRIGSLSERLSRGRGGDTRIHVWMPYMEGTYDETIFRRVLARRRELRCVLGNRPEWDRGDVDAGDESPPVDEQLVTLLQVNLGPSCPSR